MNVINIYPYSMVSASARHLKDALAEALPAPLSVARVRSDSVLRAARGRLIINWGNARPAVWQEHNFPILNSPIAVNTAGNKLLTFREFTRNGIVTPDWTDRPETATRWLAEGEVVVARTVLRGHSGEGITIVENPGELIPAPVYVKYKKKKHEFRVHVFNDNVFDIQQKKRARNVEEGEIENRSKIRNHANGWVFCREDLDLDDAHAARLNAIAVAAVAALGLDFGAVDIIYNQREDAFYVLEVNTAPGLEGQTLENYKNVFAEYIRGAL